MWYQDILVYIIILGLILFPIYFTNKDRIDYKIKMMYINLTGKKTVLYVKLKKKEISSDSSVRMVSKRHSARRGGTHTMKNYSLNFIDESGNTLVYNVDAVIYNKLYEGSKGELTVYKDMFISFKQEGSDEVIM